MTAAIENEDRGDNKSPATCKHPMNSYPQSATAFGERFFIREDVSYSINILFRGKEV